MAMALPRIINLDWSMRTHLLLGALLRLLLVGLGLLLDATCEVKYTDIDYQVFSDATKYVSQGLSPYRRPTYRYTPLIAWMLAPFLSLSPNSGKLLFCLFDLLTAWLVHEVQKRQGYPPRTRRLCACLWLYNPLPAVIATRGSSEAVMTFLVTLTLHTMDRPLISGLVYGLSVHVKIYPCIYALSFYLSFTDHRKSYLMPNRRKAAFVVASAVGFAIPTLASFAAYGAEYLEHALWYHLVRKDARHNFSPFFYAVYLADSPLLPSASSALISATSLLSAASLLLQAALIAGASWVLRSPPRRLLPAAMFVETFVFVAYNRVCTSQYFLWYLCLLPLCYPMLPRSGPLVAGFCLWVLGQGLWLLPAYLLEFQGQNTFLILSFAGLAFFCVNVALVCLFMRHVTASASVSAGEENKSK